MLSKYHSHTQLILHLKHVQDIPKVISYLESSPIFVLSHVRRTPQQGTENTLLLFDLLCDIRYRTTEMVAHIQGITQPYYSCSFQDTNSRWFFQVGKL